MDRDSKYHSFSFNHTESVWSDWMELDMGNKSAISGIFSDRDMFVGAYS